MREQIIFPEIAYDEIDQVRGMDITITTNAKDDKQGKRAAGSLQFSVPTLKGSSMAKTNMIEREKRRAKVVKKYAARRAALKETIREPKTSVEDRQAAQAKLQELPRDANPIRKRNRCAITGRSRGVYRKFGLARTKLREAAMRGEIPGLQQGELVRVRA